MTKRRKLPLTETIFGWFLILLLASGLGALEGILIRIIKTNFEGNFRYIFFPFIFLLIYLYWRWVWDPIWRYNANRLSIKVAALTAMPFNKDDKWQLNFISELKGSCNGLSVSLRNFPCLLDASINKRKYCYPDFGAEFLSELNDRQLADFKVIYPLLLAGAAKTVAVRLRDLPTIEVSLTGIPDKSERQFYSDLADALIAAFDSQGIKP